MHEQTISTKDLIKDIPRGEAITTVPTVCHCCGLTIPALDLTKQHNKVYFCNCWKNAHCFRCGNCYEHCTCGDIGPATKRKMALEELGETKPRNAVKTLEWTGDESINADHADLVRCATVYMGMLRQGSSQDILEESRRVTVASLLQYVYGPEINKEIEMLIDLE